MAPSRRQRRRPGAVAEELGDAEIEELDPPLLSLERDEDVARLEIAVHDAGLVRRLQRQAHRLEDVERVLRRQPALGLKESVEGHPLEILHHVKRPAAGELADVVDLDDARVAKEANHLDLTHEPLDHLRRLHERAVKDLDRRAARRGAMPGAIHSAASALGHEILDQVLPSLRPRRQLVRWPRLFVLERFTCLLVTHHIVSPLSVSDIGLRDSQPSRNACITGFVDYTIDATCVDLEDRSCRRGRAEHDHDDAAPFFDSTLARWVCRSAWKSGRL